MTNDQARLLRGANIDDSATWVTSIVRKQSPERVSQILSACNRNTAPAGPTKTALFVSFNMNAIALGKSVWQKICPEQWNPQAAEGAIIHLIHQNHDSPWVYTYSHCHQMITQQQPKGLRGLPEVTQNSDFSANQ